VGIDRHHRYGADPPGTTASALAVRERGDDRGGCAKVEGRDLIAIFGMEGPNLALLDAHVAALNGETAAFTLEGARATVRCRVAPTHDALDRVIGTFCLATKVERVDLREVPVPAKVA
jgi:hypothetical protein